MDPDAFAFALKVVAIGVFAAGAGIMGLIWWGLG